MKKILLPLLFVCISACANAQSKGKAAISLGPDIAFPFKARQYKTAAGVSAKLELPLTSKLQFTFSPGYIIQSKSNINYSVCAGCAVPVNTPSHFVSLKAGLRYYYKTNLYLETEAGDAIKTGEASISTFIYSAGLGATAPINQHNYIDFGVRLENGARAFDYNKNYFLNQIAMRLAYKYKF